MEKRKSQFINVDQTVLVPSPKRIRNILTLEERVRAIQAYDCRPMYTKVAKMFNCSWEQIKNIIANRDAIMQFYAATKNIESDVDPNQDEIRQRKISFLGECMYEYIQRAQFHTRADLTEELIRTKALEFRDVIQIENFTPNRAWINNFKATYNFTLSNRQILLTRTPPASMDLKDIMTYCTRNKTKIDKSNVCETNVQNLYRTTTRISVAGANDATLETLNQRRERKISFLEKALYEYMQRSQFHHKVTFNENMLRSVAYELKEMLKIDNFTPNKAWFNHFKNRFDFRLSQGVLVISRTPPLSLDLKDILSYCSRMENKNQTATPVTLTPKEPRSTQLRTAIPIQSPPDLQATKIKVRNLGNDSYSETQQSPTQIKQEIINLDEDEEQEDIKPNIEDIMPLTEDPDCQPPPLKIQKIESAGTEVEQNAHSPGHWSEHSNQEDDEELPKQVNNYEDALKLLKPLEEFAMLKENYRVIGLISQLEEIFKNPPKS